MRLALCSAIAVLTSLAITPIAEAAVLNGGFEDNLSGWEAIGDYRVESSNIGVKPAEGSSQAFLSTAFNEVIGLDNQGNEIIGGNAASATFISNLAEAESLEGFFATSTFFGEELLGGLATAEPIEGSAIKQTFTANAGETVSFSWNLLTNESTGQSAVNDLTYPEFNDFAFALIQTESSTEWFRLADTISGFSASAVPSFDQQTGVQTFSYTVPSTGNYTLGIGVVDVGEPTRISGLLVDQVAAVPECNSILGTISVLFLGAGWAATAKKRQQN